MTRSNIDNDLARLLGPDAIPDEERSSIVARLLADDEAMSQAADAAAVLRELEAEDGIVVVDETADDEPPRVGDADPPHDPKVVPLLPPSTRRTWRRPPARWLALAAMLAGVMLIPLALGRRGPAGYGDPREFVALHSDLQAGLPARWARRPWPLTRSEGDPLTNTDVGRAARLGVLWVDLEIAAASADTAQARTLCSQIGRVLVDVPAGGAVGLDCARMVPAAGPDSAVLRETGEALAGHMEYEPHFALGAWGEAARLATLRQDAGFFAAKRSRQALNRFAASDDLTPTARESARKVRAWLQSGGNPDWPALKTELDALLLAAHQPASIE